MGFLDINNEISIYEIIRSTKLELIILKVNFIFVISKDLEDSITRIYIQNVVSIDKDEGKRTSKLNWA